LSIELFNILSILSIFLLYQAATQRELIIGKTGRNGQHYNWLFLPVLPLMMQLESAALQYALEQISERKRYVFLAKALNKIGFDTLGVGIAKSSNAHFLFSLF